MPFSIGQKNYERKPLQKYEQHGPKSTGSFFDQIYILFLSALKALSSENFLPFFHISLVVSSLEAVLKLRVLFGLS